MTQPKRVIIDCDPGIDDAIALLLALTSPALSVQAITVSGGNAPVLQCAQNASCILKLLGREDIPIYLGEEKPLNRKLTTLEAAHGEGGLAGGENLPPPATAFPEKSAPQYLIETFSHTTDITLCATAPLTNLARALERRPDIAANIPHLILMGGCTKREPVLGHHGNIQNDGGVWAEYNFWCDPEAAEIVLTSGIPNITMVGLDVTRATLYDAMWDAELAEKSNPVAKAALSLLRAGARQEDSKDYDRLRQSPDEPICAIHDALVIACLLNPDLYTTEARHVKVDTTNGKRGRTRIIANDGRSKKIQVVTSMDKSGFFKLLITSLATYIRPDQQQNIGHQR